MKLFDFENKLFIDAENFPDGSKGSTELLILCRTSEISALNSVFGFDESTVIDCTDLDESVRYTVFDGYDFISIVHLELLNGEMLLREINIYVSSTYLFVVLPEHESSRLALIENKLLSAAKAAEERPGGIAGMYYYIFHILLTDFSDTLETLEDHMQALSVEIVENAIEEQFAQINSLRNMTFTAKKQLRSLSYIGEQILLDENRLIGKGQLYYFRNINTRLKKLYDFSESLYNLSGEMLYTYDSRLSMKTNDTVNKLTALTLFFGPLTVITGIYGMNFENMPELHWYFGYPLSLGAMAVVSMVLFKVLKNKKWL